MGLIDWVFQWWDPVGVVWRWLKFRARWLMVLCLSRRSDGLVHSFSIITELSNFLVLWIKMILYLSAVWQERTNWLASWKYQKQLLHFEDAEEGHVLIPCFTVLLPGNKIFWLAIRDRNTKQNKTKQFFIKGRPIFDQINELLWLYYLLVILSTLLQ